MPAPPDRDEAAPAAPGDANADAHPPAEALDANSPAGQAHEDVRAESAGASDASPAAVGDGLADPVPAAAEEFPAVADAEGAEARAAGGASDAASDAAATEGAGRSGLSPRALDAVAEHDAASYSGIAEDTGRGGPDARASDAGALHDAAPNSGIPGRVGQGGSDPRASDAGTGHDATSNATPHSPHAAADGTADVSAVTADDSSVHATAMPTGAGPSVADEGAAEAAAAGAAPAEEAPPDPALFAHALRIAEALVFASDRPVTAARLQSALPAGCDAGAVLTALSAACADRPVRLAEVAGGFAFRTAPELAPAITRVVEVPRRLPRAAMETLSIIAYHQPVTRAEIEEIRGASLSQSTLEALLDMALIAPRGHKEVPGRPSLWGTTPRFLEQFGLKALADLPRREELVNEPPTLPLAAPLPPQPAAEAPSREEGKADAAAVPAEA